MPSLMFTGKRSDVVEYLNALSWHTANLAIDDLFARNGVQRPPVHDDHPFDDVVYASGTFTGSQPTYR